MSIYDQSTLGTANNQITLSKGKVAIVSQEDFEYLNQWKWSLHSGGYAVRREYLGIKDGKEVSRYILMHREILKPNDNQEVDHINHNRLDNRRENLRLCDRSENLANNSIRKDNTSGVRGVYWFKPYKKWKVSLTFRGKEYHIGYFTDKEAAIEAKKKAVVKIHGEFANVNI